MNYFYKQLANSYKENNIQFLQQGDKLKEILKKIKSGDNAGTKHCAEFINGKFRECGFDVYGNAWNQKGVKKVVSGYDYFNKPKKYNKDSIDAYDKKASKWIYDNLKSSELDTNNIYFTNMHFENSAYQKRAFKEGKDVSSTHIGGVFWNGKYWESIHNVGGKVIKEPFVNAQKGDKYGVTALYEYEPEKLSWLDKIKKAVLSRKRGGTIKIKPENKGKFTDYCRGKVTQACITKGKNSKDPKIRKRATFADNARKWKKLEGGLLQWIS